MMRIPTSFCILILLVGCDSPTSRDNRPESDLHFKKVERDNRATYILRLPDKGFIHVTADTSTGSPRITGASITAPMGPIYSADYDANEFMIFDPKSESDVIYLLSEDRFVRAPETTQQRHKEMKQLFADFFGKHIGSGGDVEEIMKDSEELKDRLRELNKTE